MRAVSPVDRATLQLSRWITVSALAHLGGHYTDPEVGSLARAQVAAWDAEHSRLARVAAGRPDPRQETATPFDGGL